MQGTNFKKRIAIVTGANRGIGLATIQKLLDEEHQLTIILTSRSRIKGNDAMKTLKIPSDNEVLVAELDLTSSESINSFSNKIKKEYGGFDILVNNSGIASELENRNPVELEKVIRTNYFGTSNLMQKIFPLANENARIVFVSSIFGLRGMFNLVPNPNQFEGDEVFKIGQKLFCTNGSVPSIQDLDNFAEKFIRDAQNDKLEENGWPKRSQTTMEGYDMSKLLVNALCRFYASKTEKGILLNACCPGFCATDMTSSIPIDKPNTAEDGAEAIMTLIQISPGAKRPQGKFFTEC